MRPRLIFIAGPNGSGKTTITQSIVAHEWAKDVLYVNPDDIANTRYDGWNDHASIMKAAQDAAMIREAAVRDRRDILFESVLSADDKITYLLKAKQAGFFIRGFFVGTESPTINAARVARRVMEGGHTVPIEKIISRYTKSIANFTKILPHLDRGYVFDNSADGVEARILFRTVDGVLTKKYNEPLPEWSRLIAETLSVASHPQAGQDDNFDVPKVV